MVDSLMAAVLSGKGVGAIGVIGVHGVNPAEIIKKIFKPKGNRSANYQKGDMILGAITVENEIVDEVLVACEEDDCVYINCHGNQLIEADVLKLLEQNGAKVVTAEKFIARISKCNAIEIEAQIAIAAAKTLEGTKLLTNQKLSKTVNKWREENFKKIQKEAEEILEAGKTIKPHIIGAKIVLAGKPNSGKSTLLNCLAGKQKAIVTDIEGTTRDWVSAECQIGELCCEIIDTAGLDEVLFENSSEIDKTSQEKSRQLLEGSDLVLWIADAEKQIESKIDLGDKAFILVLNKRDLVKGSDCDDKWIAISAKNGAGIEKLISKINKKLVPEKINLENPFCFTERQEMLLRKIIKSNSKESVLSAITELLNGQVCV